MLHPVTLRTLVLAACGSLLAGNAMALALGQPRGNLLIGQALDVAIPLTLDSPDAEGACSSVELLYGDTRVRTDPEVRWLPGPGGRSGTLRITSSIPVDEPVVTLNLRVGCGGNVATRRYVLLPDLPRAEAAPTAPAMRAVPPVGAVLPPVAGPGTGTGGGSIPGAGTGTGTSTGPAIPRARAPAPGPAPRATAPAAAPAPRAMTARPPRSESARPAAPAVQDRPTGRSRLQLAPLELGPERDAILHFSTELTLPGVDDPRKRAEAAAMWKALNRSAEEILQDGLRLQTLDREVQALRQQTQQNAATLAALREQVQKARDARGDVTALALLLLGLLVLLGGWVGWRWYQSHRLSSVSRWFEARQPEAGDSVAPLAGAASAAAAGTAAAAVVAAGRAEPEAQAEPHLKTGPMEAPVQGPATVWPASEFQSSQGGTLRMVGVRELLDVHDKADFFLSIGQHDEAAAVLEAHVHDQVETSALPWLDLLDLYHSMGRREAFEARRAEFQERFAVQVPDFDRFDQPTRSLENYGRALSRIVALWPSQRVLEVIEESIFRKPGSAGGDSFTLEAYRELVLLYHIAQDVTTREEAPARDRPDSQSGFSATAMQSLGELDRPEPDLDLALDLDADPWPAAPVDEVARVPEGTVAWSAPFAEALPVYRAEADLASMADIGRDTLLIPPPSPRLGLDIDLTEFETPPRELPPLDFDTSEFDPDPGGKGRPTRD